MEVETKVVFPEIDWDKYEPNEIEMEEFLKQSPEKPDVFSVMGFRSEFVHKVIEQEVNQSPHLMIEEAIKLLQEKSVTEFWDAFFLGHPVDQVHEEIRKQLQTLWWKGGERKQTTYTDFHAWIDEYLKLDLDLTIERNRSLKTMYFARFQHCRTPVANGLPFTKLHILLKLEPTGGISRQLSKIQAICTDGTFEGHWTERNEVFSPDKYSNSQGKILFSELYATEYRGDSMNRDLFKERQTSGDYMHTRSFYFDQESGERIGINKAIRIRTLQISVTTDPVDKFDENILSLYKVLFFLPNNNLTFVGHRPRDYEMEKEQDLQRIEEHKKVHRLFYLIEKAIQSGVMDLDMNLAEKAVNGLGMTDFRIRGRVLEMTRCISIAYAAWSISTQVLEKQVLVRDIIPRLIITEEMVVDALRFIAF